MKSRRPRFPTKAGWAAAQAADARALATDLRYRSSAGSSIKARRKFERIAHLEAEAARFDRMAARFEERGL
ncbi:hypothetical protein LJR143_002172 [Pseudoxanthomonas sp. LjRoot143]|uniref:hypothetical protein n=1 Tax=Pseudoxanthomonas sp. LjRoot143 TaxID=3342266 RepID=UPI003ED10342